MADDIKAWKPDENQKEALAGGMKTLLAAILTIIMSTLQKEINKPQ